MRRLLRRLRSDEGAALPMVAGMMVVLLGITAFATDLGWFYLNAARIQRAADAAALAGVIRMPADFPQAEADALAVARANGYVHGVDTVDVLVDDIPADPNQLDVTITQTVPTFFARVVGLDSVTIRRQARGEYIPALKLGSPENTFGNLCDPTESGCSGQPNFWANIHGKWTPRSMGDAYSPACSSGTDNPGCATNPLHRDRGYLYGIESNGASSFTVSFIDLAFHNTSGGVDTSDFHRTGDRGCEAWGDDDADCGPTMQVTLYGPDADPLNISNNPVICGPTNIAPEPQVEESDPYVPTSPSSCFQNVSMGAGIYVLQVRIVDPGPVGDRSGLNRYSVQSSPGTSLFGLGDMSIYNNAEDTTDFYVAEVESFYANKTFTVELFDPGEGASGYLQMIDPRTGDTYTGTCRIYSRDNPSQDWSQHATPGSCQEHVSINEYNDRWVKFEMDLPSDYSCTNCWWKVNYAYGGSIPNDTTTWRAYITGNPIHLVPPD
jgi:hypothetical protein